MSDLIKEISKCVSGLIYVSEVDFPVEIFVGDRAKENDKAEIRRQTGHLQTEAIEESTFEEFFDKLIRIRDWYGSREREQAEKFLKLKNVLTADLKHLKVFKIGRIQIEIYAVGIDKGGKLIGIKTKAIET